MDGCRKSVVLAIIFATSVYSQSYIPSKKTKVPCSNDTECVTLPNTFCSDNTVYSSGVCSCTKEYVLKEENNEFECVEEAKMFNDSCQIDNQCKQKLGEAAACIQNKCRCDRKAHFINLKCWKSSKLGEICSSTNNCLASGFSECNGVCKCLPGYVANPAKTKCLKLVQDLGDPCEDSVQCKSANSLARCQFKICLCVHVGFIQSGNTCTKVNPPSAQPNISKSASGARESVAMLLIALFLFCVKI